MEIRLYLFYSPNGILAQPHNCHPLVFLQACTWGVAYEVSSSEIEGSLQYLHTREVLLGGYIITKLQFFPKEKDQEPFLALVYIATSDNPMYLGPASDTDIANQITTCRGSSGHNIEYLVRLAEFMRLCCPEVEDEHLFSIEAAVLGIIKLCNHLPICLDFSQPAPNWGWPQHGWMDWSCINGWWDGRWAHFCSIFPIKTHVCGTLSS